MTEALQFQKGRSTSMTSSPLSRAATPTIRGYIYQFDATIRKLLTLDCDGSLTIEGVEDFDRSTSLSNEYSQVKYYAAQKLTDAILRDGIIPMLTGFLKLDSAERLKTTYVLYGHFKDHDTGLLILDLRRMKEILVRRHFEEMGGTKTLIKTDLRAELMASDADLTDFAERLSILISEEYDAHKALVIQELKTALNVSYLEAEAYVYPTARTVVSEAAAKPTSADRIMNRSQFISAVSPKSAIYNEWSLREEGWRTRKR